MNEKIETIENQLTVLNKNIPGIRNSEEFFRLGVELGIEMQKIGALDYKCRFWKEKEIEDQVRSDIAKRVELINKFLGDLVKRSVKSHIENTGDWTVAKKHSGYGESERFEEETVSNFNIQLKDADMNCYEGDINVTFSVEGELRDIFNRHNIYHCFEVAVANDTGEEAITIRNTNQVDVAIGRCKSSVQNSNNWGPKEYERFLDEITKPLTFKLLTQ